MTSVLTERRGPVLLVTLNRPASYNAIDPSLGDGLSAACKEAGEPEVRAVVLTGSGRGFCAGADLVAGQSSPAPTTPDVLRHGFHPHVLRLAAVAKPVIAAVNGAAAGAGLSLACAADVRVASAAASFVPAFVKLGLVPDCGASYFLPRTIGYARAFEWLCSARTLSAEEALAWGLVSEVVEPEALVQRAVAWADEFAALPSGALAATKRLLRHGLHATLAEQLEAEVTAQVAAIASEEATEAIARLRERTRNSNST